MENEPIQELEIEARAEALRQSIPEQYERDVKSGKVMTGDVVSTALFALARMVAELQIRVERIEGSNGE